ncbi:hypothetical protein BP6252_12539 [Coleophoma cylindrospora]|uniref:F-box domain-containing protein n=1 Tax=Coleophoma cylindrospora TaxID=1849047 RepID=A0A3D8QC72_9HELO|nr:hypothetical protein BP6252_12539 [Coleophoma cylindrospora]
MSFSHLPNEVLHHIVRNLSSPSDLRTCSLLSHAFLSVTRPILYREIDFTADNEGFEDEELETTIAPQVQLLKTLSEKACIGSLVHKLRCHDLEFTDYFDPFTVEARLDPQDIIQAAKNMTSLIEADLAPCMLAAHIITNLHAYPNLRRLKVTRLDPGTYIWGLSPCPLTHLEWRVKKSWPANPHLKSIEFLATAIAATCPMLKSFDIVGCDLHRSNPERVLPESTSDNPAQYELMTGGLKFSHLEHFGLSKIYDMSHDPGDNPKIKGLILELVQSCGQTLTSITIPILVSADRTELAFLTKVCSMLPKLKSLQVSWHSGSTDFVGISPKEFFSGLIIETVRLGLEIEHFTVSSLGCPFDEEMGSLFSLWPSLRTLRVCDGHNAGGPYDSSSRMDFESYDILSFIRELPPSLEELYIEISAETLFVDEDDDFDPFCSIGKDIFEALKRLHTCDLMAWICDTDMTTGPIPEKAVHYRRLRHAKGEQYKNLWTSRQDRIYQEDNSVITHSSVEIQGEFEGKDAKNAWLDANEEGELDDSKSIDEPMTRQFETLEDSDLEDNDLEDNELEVSELEDDKARGWPHNQDRNFQDRVRTYEMYERC